MLVVGSVNMDIVVRAPRAPEPGETVTGTDYALYAGGKGANQAVAARRAGARVRLVAAFGRDAYGDKLFDSLTIDDVDLSAARRVETDTGVALITVDARGENRIIVVPGANHDVRPEDVPAGDGAGAVLLAQLEVPLATVIAAARGIRAAGGLAIVNLSPVAGLGDAELDDLLRVTDIPLVNQTEAGRLLGAGTIGAPVEAAARLARGRRGAVVTLGRDGVAWHADGEGGHLPAHRVAVVDTTACGDAFAGALAASIEAGASLAGAVRIGNAAGALAATRRGAQPSLPDRAAIEAFLASHV